MANWSLARVLSLSLFWAVVLFAIAAVRSDKQRRALERQHGPGREYYVAAHIPGGRWMLIGPPLLLILWWLWSHASRRAS